MIENNLCNMMLYLGQEQSFGSKLTRYLCLILEERKKTLSLHLICDNRKGIGMGMEESHNTLSRTRIKILKRI